MRVILVLGLLSFISCGKPPANHNQEIEMLETQMAEIRGPQKISKQDSIALLKSFKIFIRALQNQDGILMAEISEKKEHWPSSLNAMLQLPPAFPAFLISKPIKNLYKKETWNAIQNDIPKFNFSGRDYQIEFTTKHVSKRAITGIGHNFKFVKLNNIFKFSFYKERKYILEYITPSIDSIQLYFPSAKNDVSKSSDRQYLNDFSNVWYSEALSECGEPLLYNYKGEDEIYRFSWSRSFDPPVVIRFQKHSFNFSVTTKMLGERFYDYPHELIENTVDNVIFFKWMFFKNKINNANFWDIELKDTTPMGGDGTSWVLEGVKNGKYHVVERWSPRATEFGKACLYLLDLSSLKLTKKEIY